MHPDELEVITAIKSRLLPHSATTDGTTSARTARQAPPVEEPHTKNVLLLESFGKNSHKPARTRKALFFLSIFSFRQIYS